jgi:outer membrane protein assembly factor BamE (lipoprotein component of BamABCDE complex)
MPEAEVEALLGSPSRVDAMGSFTVWYYGSQSVAQVTFDAKSRTVRSWSEP